MSLMTVAEFAQRLKTSKRSAYRIIAARQVDITPIGTGTRPRIRISEAALAKYIAEHEVAA